MKLLATGLERHQIDSIQAFLSDIRIDVTRTASASEMMARLTRETYDAVLARDRLQDMNAFDLIRAIREGNTIPIVMIGKNDDEVGRVVGLEVGADDYVCDQCAPREVAARVRAVLRRAALSAGDDQGSTVLQAGDLVMDRGRREVRIGDDPVSLTGAEFRMLEKLLMSRGEPVTRNALAVYALARHLAINDRSIDTHMSRLRRKLGPLSNGEPRIQSVRGFGYFIADGASMATGLAPRQAESRPAAG